MEENMSELIKYDVSPEDENRDEFETIRIKKTHSSCSLCEDYAKKQAVKPIAILSCEGACLRGRGFTAGG